VSTTPSKPPRAAENALWYALEERRDQIRAAGLTFSERQHHQLREAHDKGNLIQGLGGGVERYKGNGNEYYLRPMAQAIKHGLPTLEHVLIRPGEPWTPYVTPGARRGAQRAIADATAYIPFL
jgi:hypothetical protein